MFSAELRNHLRSASAREARSAAPPPLTAPLARDADVGDDGEPAIRQPRSSRSVLSKAATGRVKPAASLRRRSGLNSEEAQQRLFSQHRKAAAARSKPMAGAPQARSSNARSRGGGGGASQNLQSGMKSAPMARSARRSAKKSMPAMARRASPSPDSDDHGDDDGDCEDEEDSRRRSSSPTEGKSEESLLRSGAASGAESSGAGALFTEIRRGKDRGAESSLCLRLAGSMKKKEKKKRKSKTIESRKVAVAGAKR